VFEQLALQLLQGSGHLFEWRPIAQGTRLALNQLNIVLPVVDGLITLKAAGQPYEAESP
jgi:hypothetical protein